jgi:hypothetical protein
MRLSQKIEDVLEKQYEITTFKATNEIDPYGTKCTVDVHGLKSTILAAPWSQSSFKNNHRKLDNFESAEIFAFDIDEGNYLDQAKKAVKDYKHIIGTTKSHNKTKNGKVAERFRIILFFDKQVTSADKFKELLQQYKNDIIPNIECDKSTYEASRYWSKCTEVISFNPSGKLLPADIFVRTNAAQANLPKSKKNPDSVDKAQQIKECLDSIDINKLCSSRKGRNNALNAIIHNEWNLEKWTEDDILVIAEILNDAISQDHGGPMKSSELKALVYKKIAKAPDPTKCTYSKSKTTKSRQQQEDKSKKKSQSVVDVYQWLGTNFPDNVAYDENSHQLVMAKPWTAKKQTIGAVLTDLNAYLNLRRRFIDEVGPVQKQDIIDACVEYYSDNNHINSMLDDINAIPECENLYDIDNMAYFFGVEPNDMNNLKIKYWLRQLWMRTKHPGCRSEACLILSGKQESGKTSLLRKIARQKYTHALTSQITNKDQKAQYCGKSIIIFDEITFNKNIEELRSHITEPKMEYRRPYDRNSDIYPMTAVFAGCTNDKRLLNDPAGNRRWWIIDVVVDKIPYQKLNVNRLWHTMKYDYEKNYIANFVHDPELADNEQTVPEQYRYWFEGTERIALAEETNNKYYDWPVWTEAFEDFITTWRIPNETFSILDCWALFVNENEQLRNMDINKKSLRDQVAKILRDRCNCIEARPRINGRRRPHWKRQEQTNNTTTATQTN